MFWDWLFHCRVVVFADLPGADFGGVRDRREDGQEARFVWFSRRLRQLRRLRWLWQLWRLWRLQQLRWWPCGGRYRREAHSRNRGPGEARPCSRRGPASSSS